MSGAGHEASAGLRRAIQNAGDRALLTRIDGRVAVIFPQQESSDAESDLIATLVEALNGVAE